MSAAVVTVIAIAGLILSVTAMIWSINLLRRNDRVLEYRKNLIARTNNASRLDIQSGLFDNDWRWKAYESVSYSEMVHKFWKPLDSFYPNLDFTEPRKQQ